MFKTKEEPDSQKQNQHYDKYYILNGKKNSKRFSFQFLEKQRGNNRKLGKNNKYVVGQLKFRQRKN